MGTRGEWKVPLIEVELPIPPVCDRAQVMLADKTSPALAKAEPTVYVPTTSHVAEALG